MSLVVTFLVATLITASCLWLGMKATQVDGTFLGMLIVASIGCLLQLLLPWLGDTLAGETGWIIAASLGWVAVAVVMLVLITKVTDADFWPDAVLMVIVANVAAVVVTSLVPGFV
jgi:hypothetical protein